MLSKAIEAVVIYMFSLIRQIARHYLSEIIRVLVCDQGNGPHVSSVDKSGNVQLEPQRSVISRL